MTTVTLMRGAITVKDPPPGLKDRLTYWRRELVYDRQRHMRSVKGHYENLYTTAGDVLTTLPGFGHRILEHLRKSGTPHTLVDNRLPLPKPDIDKACQGLRDYQLEPLIRMALSGGGILSAATGFGKALADDSLVPTPSSFRPVGTIRPGDFLFGSDGNPVRVVAIHPQGVKQVWRVTFDDGRVVECCKDHLWKWSVRTDDKAYWKITSTEDLAKAMACSKALHPHVPLCRPLNYPERDLPIGPKTYAETVAKEAYASAEEVLAIADEFMESSIEQRIELKNAIVGECGIEGTSVLCKSSNRPSALQFASLCYGLGESVRVVRAGKLSWHVVGTGKGYLGIKDIRPADREVSMTCFTVDAEDHLFLCNDYVVTHNTRITSALIRAFDPEQLKLRGTPTVVFAAPDKDINRKNFEELSAILSEREVGLVMSGVRKFSSDVQVITLDSLHLLDPNEVGILIVDEVHTSASSSRSESISKFSKAARWGVSATPSGRFDGGDILLEGLFGPVVCQRTYQDAVRLGALVPIEVYWVKAPPPQVGLDYYAHYRTRDAKIRAGIINNPAYSKLVAGIMQRIPDNKSAICFTQFIAQMANIHANCPEIAYVHAQTKDGVGTIGPITNKQRKAIYEDVKNGDIKKIFATYVWKQG